MPKPSHAAAALAVLLLAAQPCAAADDIRDSAAAQRRTSAFAGVGLTIPLGAKGRAAAPSARLQLTPTRLSGGPLAQGPGAPGLELGLGKAGKPSLYLGGQSTADIERRLNLGGSKGTTLIVIGGIVLVVLIAAAVASAAPQPGPPEGAFD